MHGGRTGSPFAKSTQIRWITSETTVSWKHGDRSEIEASQSSQGTATTADDGRGPIAANKKKIPSMLVVVLVLMRRRVERYNGEVQREGHVRII